MEFSNLKTTLKDAVSFPTQNSIFRQLDVKLRSFCIIN